jgi:hypothetical protein
LGNSFSLFSFPHGTSGLLQFPLRSSPHQLLARLHIGAANNRHLYTLQASNATMSAIRAQQEAAATILLDPRVASDTRGKGPANLEGCLEGRLEGLGVLNLGG